MDAQEMVLVKAAARKLETLSSVLLDIAEISHVDKTVLRAYVHDIRVLLNEATVTPLLFERDRKTVVRWAAKIVAGE